MSSGKFIISRYQSTMDAGGIYKIRIQPDTALASMGLLLNDPPTESVNRSTSARVRGSKRMLGLNARILYLALRLGEDPPGEYSLDSVTSIPALTESFYILAVASGELEYLGVTWRVTGGRPEYLR